MTAEAYRVGHSDRTDLLEIIRLIYVGQYSDFCISHSFQVRRMFLVVPRHMMD